jgi:uncharacterized protein
MERYRLVRLQLDCVAAGEASWRLCRLLKRNGRWRECLDIWAEESLSAQDLSRKVRALVELAKLYEHKLKKPADALDLALSAMTLASPQPSRFVTTLAALAGRIARLETRCFRLIPAAVKPTL